MQEWALGFRSLVPVRKCACSLSIEQAVKLGKDRQVGIGILEHPGPGYKIQNDGDLTQYFYPAWAARAASSVAALS
jgi:hypothetical protein